MKLLKVLGLIVGGATILVVAAAAAIYLASERRFHRSYELAAEEVVVPNGAQAVERGAHVALVRGCTECHGADLGGRVFVDDPMLGYVVTSNLTTGAGGIGGRYMPGDWERAVRHGVGPDARALLIMPSTEMRALGPEDLGDLIAYLRSLPPVDRELPPSRPGPLARALLVFDQADILAAEHIDHAAPHPAAPAAGATVEYGGYLAMTCTGCHKPDYAGGPIPGSAGAVAANLTPDDATGLGRWSEEDFFRVLRTGVRPDGAQVGDAMPWPLTAKMSDTELRAIWLFLRTLPPLQARTQ